LRRQLSFQFGDCGEAQLARDIELTLSLRYLKVIFCIFEALLDVFDAVQASTL
jgi:hypothetical protein